MYNKGCSNDRGRVLVVVAVTTLLQQHACCDAPGCVRTPAPHGWLLVAGSALLLPLFPSCKHAPLACRALFESFAASMAAADRSWSLNRRSTSFSASLYPPSRKMAAITASKAPARMEGGTPPPVAASVAASSLPSRTASCRSSRSASRCSASSFTHDLRTCVRSPSEEAGRRVNSMCATARSSTESPRNSRRSLLSGPALQCVSARNSRLSSLNSYCSRSWSSARLEPPRGAAPLARAALPAPPAKPAPTPANDILAGAAADVIIVHVRKGGSGAPLCGKNSTRHRAM